MRTSPIGRGAGRSRTVPGSTPGVRYQTVAGIVKCLAYWYQRAQDAEAKLTALEAK